MKWIERGISYGLDPDSPGFKDAYLTRWFAFWFLGIPIVVLVGGLVAIWGLIR